MIPESRKKNLPWTSEEEQKLKVLITTRLTIIKKKKLLFFSRKKISKLPCTKQARNFVKFLNWLCYGVVRAFLFVRLLIWVICDYIKTTTIAITGRRGKIYSQNTYSMEENIGIRRERIPRLSNKEWPPWQMEKHEQVVETKTASVVRICDGQHKFRSNLNSRSPSQFVFFLGG